MSKSRIFLLLLLSFIAGVGFGSFWIPWFSLIWILVLAAFAAVVTSLKRRNKTVIIGGFMLIMFLSGVWRFSWAENMAPDLTPLFGRRIVFQGIVWEEPEIRDLNQRLKVKIYSVADEKINSFFALITLRRYPKYEAGEYMSFNGLLQAPPPEEDGNTYGKYLAKDGVFALSYFPKANKENRKQNSFVFYLLRLKRGFEEKINLAFPEPYAVFLRGLLLGERTSFPAELTRDFQKSGVSHLVALSGYNITIIGRFLLIVFTFLYIPFAASFWLASLGIVVFVLLAGASPSLVRAAVMGILVLLARREGRGYHITNALVLAGAVMVAINPLILRFDAGFQLSFLATAGLIFLSPGVEKTINNAAGFLRKKITGGKYSELVRARPAAGILKKTLVETLAAQIAVLPLLIFLFGSVSLVSPLTNVLVISAVPYAMGWGFVSSCLGFLSTALSRLAAVPAWLIMWYQLKVIKFFAGFSFSSFTFGKFTGVLTVFLYFAAAFWWFWLRRKNKEEI